MRKSKLIVAHFFLLLMILSHQYVFAETIYSDEELLAQGHDSYQHNNYQKAAMYLYAYIQRDPLQLKNDDAHARQVQEALNYSLGSRVADVKGDSMISTPQAKPKPDFPKPRPSTPPSTAPQFQLDGKWSCNDGGTYYIKQADNTLWWYGRSSDNKSWANVFHGNIRGNTVSGDWTDLPNGRARNMGTMQLKIKGNNKIESVRKTGGFGGNLWYR